MLGIVLVEQVVDARRDLRALGDAIGTVHREYAEAAGAANVLADDIPLIGSETVLRGNHAQQAACRPDLVVVSRAQTRFQWRYLAERRAVGVVAAAHVSQAAVQLPAFRELVCQPRFRAPSGGVDVAGNGNGSRRNGLDHTRLDQDEVIDLAVEARYGGRPLPGLVDRADIELCGLFRIGIEGAVCGQAFLVGGNQLPVIREALGVTEPDVRGVRIIVTLVTGEAAAQRLVPALPGSRVGDRISRAGRGFGDR